MRPKLTSLPQQQRSRVPSWFVHFALGFGCAILFLVTSISLYASMHGSSSSVLLSKLVGRPVSSSSSSSPYPSTLNPLPVIVAFGDSLTQRGFVSETAQGDTYSGWVGSLGNYMVRKADVINRGYSGFNTKLALDLHLVEEQVMAYRFSPDLVILCFGANDAIDENAPQYVSIDNYKNNLLTLISQIKSSGGNSGKVVDIILLTPPPVYEPDLEANNIKKNKAIIKDRTNDRTRLYAQASVAVAKQLMLPVVDLWSELGGDSVDRKEYLADGLHFNKRGNDKVFSLIKQLLEGTLTRWSGDKLTFVVPPHYNLLHQI